MNDLGSAVRSLRSAVAAIRCANGQLSRAQHGGFQLSKHVEIAALQIEVGPGVCCFCEEPLPEVRPGVGRPGRPPMNCGRRECRRSHLRLLQGRHRSVGWPGVA